MDTMDTICENCDSDYMKKVKQEYIDKIKKYEFEILYLRNCIDDLKRQLNFMGFYDNPIMYAPH